MPPRNDFNFFGNTFVFVFSGAASSISEGAIFIYSCSGQLSPFEIKSISKELNWPEHEYMNMAPSLIELAAPLFVFVSDVFKNKGD